MTIILLLAACASSTSPGDRRTAGDVAPTPIPTSAAPTRPTYTVERGEVVYQVSFPGRMTPLVENPLAFAVDGVVETVHLERGDTVQAGELIAELDTQAWEEELARAQAQLAIAQTRLDTAATELAASRRQAEIAMELAQLDLDYARQQAGDSPTPAQALEIARLELLLESAQIELDRLATTVDPVLEADAQEAALRLAELESILANTSLVAPFAGQITSLRLSPGQAVIAQEPVGTVADVSQLEVGAGLQPNRLGELAENMPVIISAAGRPGDSYAGVIRQLPFANDEEGLVRITLDDPDAAASFSAGDRVNVTVVVERHPGVLWLPPAAIRDFNGRKFIVVQDGAVQRRVDVTLGLVSNDRIEIVSGVSEGEVVIGQ
ncbi:MAG: efflux RND transporter periplasmic adaptor subunit [Chloroflexi bacterium]|nr:efflux RND transporter periplasmic adaptor subunit [Chloroflexota bacterium]MCI0579271.1 efflux RND transporter periplasmic adaptor subunit [Chloroflexota bacterium]MCI0643470.1 efflux RND transporter periplasmic adaptor subunit [Chloroflexota bacterium]MCI0728566.1 efflux RND transporter periplasmic adaptor subunit [Chloroflexota bacterium]